MLKLILNNFYIYSVFNCFGHAQRPAASFLHSEIHLDHLFLNIEHEFTYKLCNHSMLRADFVWGQVNWRFLLIY